MSSCLHQAQCIFSDAGLSIIFNFYIHEITALFLHLAHDK